MWKRATMVVWLAVAWLGVGGCLAAAPSAPTWAPPGLAEVQARLDGLAWDEFLETSYRLYLLRFPETVTRMGVAEAFGVRNDRLNDYSEVYVKETMSIESEVLARLAVMDRSTLSPSQQAEYDTCVWYWDDLVRGHAFADCDYPINHMFVISLDQLVRELLVEIHPLSSIEDVEDYVARLEQVGGQFDGILAGLDRRAAEGVIVPQRIIDWTLYGVQQEANSSWQSSAYYTRLRDALPGVVGLSVGDAQTLLSRAGEAVSRDVLPAYRRLSTKLSELRRIAPRSIGIGSLPNGPAYYQYLLRHFTGTDLTAQEIHEIGLREVARLHEEVRACAAALGYPADASIAELFGWIQQDGGTLYNEDIMREYDRLIESAKVNALSFLSRLPATEVVVKEDPVGGFYRSAPRDGSLPAAFGAQTTGAQPRFTMPTLAYHETIPGHHVQIALAQEMDLPLLLSETGFLGFTEGWALYAERLAWEFGWYEGDPYGNLGRLQFELMRAARLVVDTGIHALGWSYEDAAASYQEATGRSPQLTQSDVYRYAVWPGQAVSYHVGYLALLDLRMRAETVLGDRFDLMAFHDALLSLGNAPLPLVEDAVEAFIATQGE